MAIYRKYYTIGDTVYRPFATYNPGIVMEVLSNGYTIKWLNGKVTSTGGLQIASFDDLIQDHLKKAETHSRKRDKLRVEEEK